MADLRPPDDESIPGEEPLYLRVYPAADSLVPVEDGGYRPMSGSVKGREADEPLSVDLGSLCTPAETRDRGTDGRFHVAMIHVAAIRAIGLRVARDPIGGDQPNPAHALVYGSRQDKGKNFVGGLTGGEYSSFARAARFVLIYSEPQDPP